MALIKNDQHIVRKVVQQGRGRLTGLPATEMARIVLNPLAITDFTDHLQIEMGPLLDPLSFKLLSCDGKFSDARP